jgi:hypothetical protein
MWEWDLDYILNLLYCVGCANLDRVGDTHIMKMKVAGITPPES